MDNTTKDRPVTLSTPGLRAAIRVRTVAKLVGLIALTALFAVACRHPVGLFASLEEEIAVDEERGVPTSDGMQEMLLSGGNYYAAFTSLYVRKAAESRDLDGSPSRQWSKVGKPEDLGSDDTLGSIAEYGGHIYAVYGGEVYRRPNDGGDESGDWESVWESGNSRPTGRASRLFAAAGELLVSVRTDTDVGEDDETVGEYKLYEWDDGNTDWNTNEVDFDTTGNEVSFIYAVVQRDTNDIFIATHGNIYQAGGLGGNFTPEDTTITSGSYRDLLVADTNGDGNNTLYSAAKGRILSYDGSDWTAGSKQTDDEDDPVQFTSLGWYTDSRVIDDSDASNGYLIAGSLDNGLYEAEDGNLGTLEYEGAESTLFGRGGNYLTTQLSENGIQSIFVDDPGQGSWRSSGPHIFIGAAGQGLWRGEFDEDDELNDLYWRRE